MTFPGAETMKCGIIGLDCFLRDLCLRGILLPVVRNRGLLVAPLAPPDSCDDADI